MQPVHQIASNVTRKHGKKQHDKSNDLSTIDPNLSRVIHFFRSKRRKLSGLINTECLTQRSSLSKQDESQSANELTKSHISAWQLKFSKRPTRKQCLHITFLFQVWISDTFKNNWPLCCILRQQVNKCTKVLTVKSSPTRESDQQGREEPELVLDPKWYVIFCTRRRSGRSCMLTWQLQKQDQEEYIHLEFVLHQ